MVILQRVPKIRCTVVYFTRHDTSSLPLQALPPLPLTHSLTAAMQSREKRKLSDSTEVREQNDPKHRRVIGPSFPEASSDSDEDDFGPSLPPSNDRPAHHADDPPPMLQSPRPEIKETRRDRWMLQPPEQSDWATKIDPTKLRSRKFQTGKSARTPAPKQVDAAWVETPEERMKRLQDEVMGITASSAEHAKQQHITNNSASRATKSAEEKIKRHNDITGKNVRLESPAHLRKEKDDDPSMRAFDREKDMAVTSRISHTQRREMMDRASDYNSRFTKGNFL